MIRTVLGLTMVMLAAAAGATDLEAGKKKVTEVCAACHGADGNSQSAEFPRLAGQHADYLSKALRDYKSGARKDPVMSAFANQLSAQDIDNVTAYFESQKGLQFKY
jgi:cytochrome c553